MSRVLTQREKVLSFIVGGAVLFIVNLFIIDYALGMWARLSRDTTVKRAQLRAMKTLLTEAPRGAREDAELRAKQPRLENEATAGVQLLNQVQQAAAVDGVTVEQPAIGPVERKPTYTSVSVTLDTKSPWKALVLFLAKLQAPGQFIVVETGELQIDQNDLTQMRGKFKISKWYAPK
jgi:type II secretory pathway component PulM